MEMRMSLTLTLWIEVVMGALGGIIVAHFCHKKFPKDPSLLPLYLTQYLGLLILCVLPLSIIGCYQHDGHDGLLSYMTGAAALFITLVSMLAILKDDDRRKRWKKKASDAVRKLMEKVQEKLAPPIGIPVPIAS